MITLSLDIGGTRMKLGVATPVERDDLGVPAFLRRPTRK